MKQATIWVIDDDVALRLILEDALTDANFMVQTFGNAKVALDKLNALANDPLQHKAIPQVILTDIRMPLLDGLSFSQQVHHRLPQLPIIIMTAHADVQSAVDSYQTGAFDYLPKPFNLDDMLSIVEKAMQQTDFYQSLIDEALPDTAIYPIASLDKPSATSPIASYTEDNIAPPSGIIGQSSAMQAVFRAIGRLSNMPINVLITGESGTGKELIAHALHEHSPRQPQPFIALNMAAIPQDLIESELFGHEKGAFTGATTTRQGRFEQAHKGTLFLDEIGDMPLPTQTRLLRVLANGEFFRVGGLKPIKVDVRIIAATHQPLETLVKMGKFREDLFYRINVIRLALPALRERPEDIPLLVHYFMQRIAKDMKVPAKTVSSDTLRELQAFDWQGNVRQLENTCRWLMVMASGQQVQVTDLPPEIQHHTPPSGEASQDVTTAKQDMMHQSTIITALPNAPLLTPLNTDTDWQTPLSLWAKQVLASEQPQQLQTVSHDFERCLLQVVLDHTHNHKGKAADLLGWGRNTVTRKFQTLLANTSN